MTKLMEMMTRGTKEMHLYESTHDVGEKNWANKKLKPLVMDTPNICNSYTL
jgi:hypothetical protein